MKSLLTWKNCQNPVLACSNKAFVELFVELAKISRIF